MKKVLSFWVITSILISCSGENKEASTSAATDTTTAAETQKAIPAAEIMDLSKADPVKKGMLAFASRDVEGMTAEYADSIRYYWSGGDSLVGKQAVKDYYNGRLKLIDSLHYTDFIFLPLKVNESQTPAAPTGDYVLAWAFVHVKYKNGKKLDFWLHNVNHYNSGGKIDFVSQYMDRAPINAAAMGMKK